MSKQNECAICSVKKSFHRRTSNYVTCSHCGTHQALSFPSKAELSEYYSSHYIDQAAEVPEAIRARLRSLVKSFATYRTGEGALCDVGFGEGALLDEACHENWTCFGTEYSEIAVKKAVDKGYQAFLGDLSDSHFRFSFDVMTLIETLEHVIDPRALLLESFQNLRPGGLLFGTTPNGLSLNSRLLGERWSVYSLPQHLYLFNENSLGLVLEEVGFCEIRVHTSGFNPSDILNALFSMMARSKSQTSAKLNRVEVGHQLVSLREQSRALSTLVQAIQFALRVSRLGDSIVFSAQKPTRRQVE